jgi:ElaB/YqjD/DUF883 family membrane-anchored ribosome-binding protein
VQTTAERVKDAAAEAGREVAPELKSSLKDAAATVGQQVKESASRVAEEAKQAASRRDEGREPDTM